MQESLNGELPLPSADDTKGTTSRIKLSSTMDPKRHGYRYQFERLMERSEGSLLWLIKENGKRGAEWCDWWAVLDSAIDEAAEALHMYYNIDTDWSDPSAPSQVCSPHHFAK